MQKVPPRKPKQLLPGVPKLKLSSVGSDYGDFPSADKELNMKNLQNTLNRTIMTTSSQSTNSICSSSSSSSQVTVVKSNLSELKNNISEMKNQYSSSQNLKKEFDQRCNSPVITFPDETPTPSEISSPPPSAAIDTLKFEQTSVNNIMTSKVVSEGFSAEEARSQFQESKSVQSNEMSYEENQEAASVHKKLEMDGQAAEKSTVKAKEVRSLLTPDKALQHAKNMERKIMKMTSGGFTKNSSVQAQNESKTIVSNGSYSTSQSRSNVSMTTVTGMHTSSSSKLAASDMFSIKNEKEPDALLNITLDDLNNLKEAQTREEVDAAISKYSTYMSDVFRVWKIKEPASGSKMLDKLSEIMYKAWTVPKFGHEVGTTLCNTLRTCGGLDILMENCSRSEDELSFSTAKLLEQCLTTENRSHVVSNGLDKVVRVACLCTKKVNAPDHNRVGIGILEHMFKHSEETCGKVVALGGLDALLFECRKSDVNILRHCAGALANLSLYGGAENQEAMIKKKVPMWLYPLAFHQDDNIKYYACLAITVLVANAEIEAQVIQSGTLELVEPFVTSHNPSDFAKSNLAHAHGQSKTWLQHLVPVLSSKREEARNLAAFHFCMEAGIKKEQGNTHIFNEIGATQALKLVASCPNAVASKYAARALRLIGEEVPHKLSQQVPLWSTDDVEEWVKQIGFTQYAPSFAESRVDGDLLLQLTEENLKQDIGLTNGIQRARFFRELQKLKKLADYSSRDPANINNFLQSMAPEFSSYTYAMLNAGVESQESLRSLSEDQLLNECGIINSIHRLRIIEGIRALEDGMSSCRDDNLDKSLDVFVSYRRSTGSQLASLLKVHLQLRGFSVFIDVERLEAGKFDNNLLQSIQKAKHFLLVLTPNALDRCIGDEDRKDWVHREIVAALKAQCNIIPIIDNFKFPDAEELPEDMRQVCHFNAIKWIHDYQDACVEKLERFMRSESNIKGDGKIPSTPSTQAMRNQPGFQRMHSNDSGSGKSSEKDALRD